MERDVSVASRTDVGRVRQSNEDSFLVDSELGLYVVCDGMGGHAAGEVASKLACEVIQRELKSVAKQRQQYLTSGRNADAKLLRKSVENAIVTACKEVYKKGSKSPELAGMGTTCTTVLMIGNSKAILGHVGDSRLFVCRQGTLHQLSDDHTYVNELLRRGALTKEQAANHPHGNVLSRALGVQPSIAVDTMIFDLDPGDTYLLCSDGLHNYFSNWEELAYYMQAANLEQGLGTLVDLALERGGHDNTTGVMFRVGGAPPPPDDAVAAEQRIAILKQIPLFQHLTYNELVEVLGLTYMLRSRPGETIITEGEKGSEFYVVLAGEVDVLKSGSHITTLQAGVHLGEMALVDNAPRSATIRAKNDVTLLAMRREEFFGLVRGQPVIATKLLWSFVKVLSGRLRETNEALQGARQELDVDAEEFEIFVDEE